MEGKLSMDRFAIFGWMKVYFRQLAKTTGFLDKAPAEQWALLRKYIMDDSPTNDAGRAEAIDGVRDSERPEVLTWLRQKSK